MILFFAETHQWKKAHLLRMQQSFHRQLAIKNPHSHTYRRKAPQMSSLWNDFYSLIQPAFAHTLQTHFRKEFYMQRMCKSVHGKTHVRRPHENSHRRKEDSETWMYDVREKMWQHFYFEVSYSFRSYGRETFCLWCVWETVCSKAASYCTYKESYRGEAVCVFWVRESI